MTSAAKVDSEITSFFEDIFKKEELENLEYTTEGTSEKGDGYISEINFIEVTGTTKNNGSKKYHVVLKCAKSSEKLREKFPVKEAFSSEIFFYDVLLPTFLQFQKEKNIEEPFEKVPKCYGTSSTGTREMIALENIKNKGYILWDRTKPLTRKQIDMIVEHYAKLHAVSIAMRDQEPEKFQKLVDSLSNSMESVMKATGMITVLENVIDEIYELLEDDEDKNVLHKWMSLKPKIRPFFDAVFNSDDFEVIVHGDCWGNNFMHYCKGNEPVDFVILDWQMMTYASPVVDLSYFLFTSLSKEDMNDFDVIAHHYYKNLTENVKKLGSNLDILYPLNQFLDDLKKYGKFGLIISTVIHKYALTEKGEVPDMAEAAEKGEDAASAFSTTIKNTVDYKKRLEYIVKYVVENDLI